MQNLIIAFLVIFLSSCFGGGQIIIDEDKINSNDDILSSDFDDKTITNTEARNTLNNDNNSFSSEDIEIASDEKLIGSGVRSYSSNYAKESIIKAKQSNPNLSFIIYFAFDSDGLDSKAQSIINNHKEVLAKYPKLGLRLEGHTDEKGTREYNLSLGELRAIAVRDALGKKADAVSFGEEKTVSSTDNLNRRVEIIYK